MEPKSIEVPTEDLLEAWKKAAELAVELDATKARLNEANRRLDTFSIMSEKGCNSCAFFLHECPYKDTCNFEKEYGPVPEDWKPEGAGCRQ